MLMYHTAVPAGVNALSEIQHANLSTNLSSPPNPISSDVFLIVVFQSGHMCCVMPKLPDRPSRTSFVGNARGTA